MRSASCTRQNPTARCALTRVRLLKRRVSPRVFSTRSAWCTATSRGGSGVHQAWPIGCTVSVVGPMPCLKLVPGSLVRRSRSRFSSPPAGSTCSSSSSRPRKSA